VLPPDAQCEIWSSLRRLRDPWFLANDDDRETFRDLANRNTGKIIREILQDQTTGVHLKIAALEAVANSSEDLGVGKVIRDLVLQKNDNTWLRSTAVSAFANTVKNDWVQMELLDSELAKFADDLDAAEVRIHLLTLTRGFGNFPQRILSIMEQSICAKKQDRIIGRLYSLMELPLDTDLKTLLDGASRLSIPEDVDCYEIGVILDEWLNRRLKLPAPITPKQLSGWLLTIRSGRDRRSDEALEPLKERFERKPSLFEGVFKELAEALPNKEQSFWLFLLDDLWKILPPNVWPVDQSEFFLTLAKEERDPEKAADLFRMYLNLFPEIGATVALAEAGLDFMQRRPDVGKELGNWPSCKLQKKRLDQFKRRKKQRRKQIANQAQNIAYLTPRLSTIREGKEEYILAWASFFYLGLFQYSKKISDAHDRLVSVTNDEIADAIIQGFIRYVEMPNIPKKGEIINSWLEGKIPKTHLLLCLSVFLRLKAGMTIHEKPLAHCLTAVVTAFHAGEQIPDYDRTLSGWYIHQCIQNPSISKSVLKELWILGANKKQGILPGFYELRQDSRSQQFLAALSGDVLRAGINDNPNTVRELVFVLLLNNHQEALAIGKEEIASKDLSMEVRTIWSTALFVIDPNNYSEAWKALMSQEGVAIWEAIEIIKGDHHRKRGSVILTSKQRAAIIRSLGSRNPNIGHPPGGWSGSQNLWDISEFIANQIRLLAADSSIEAGTQLENLEKEADLASYRELIRHHRA